MKSIVLPSEIRRGILLVDGGDDLIVFTQVTVFKGSVWVEVGMSCRLILPSGKVVTGDSLVVVRSSR